jgi:GTPase
MRHQRLDALVILSVADREVKNAFVAHLVPDPNTPWIILPSLSLVALTEQNFDELVKEWEREIAQAGGTFLSQEIVSNQDKVLLVGVQTDDVSPQRFEDGLSELMRLVESAGGIVLEVVRQKRDRPHPQTFVGKGKVEEITLLAQKLGANLIAFDRDISPSVARNLENEIGDSETLAQAQQKYPQAVFISATKRLGLDTLKMRSLELIDQSVESIAVSQNSS